MELSSHGRQFQVVQELIDEGVRLSKPPRKNSPDLLAARCEEESTQRISAETFHKIETKKMKKATVNNRRRRALKAKAQNKYAKTNNIRRDKRNFEDEMTEEAATWAT